MRPILPMLLLPILLCVSALRAADPGYAVVVSSATYAKAEWRAVADALVQKHTATLVVHTGSITTCRTQLAALMPRYTAFVAEPQDIGRVLIAQLHRLTRALDSDPYGDTIWGVVSAATASGALRVATATEPRTVSTALTLTGVNLALFSQYFGISDGKAGDWVWKQPDGTVTNGADGDADRTALFLRHFTTMQPDLLVGSGHATEGNLEMCFSKGNSVAENGRWHLVPRSGQRTTIPTNDHPRVFLGAGNCLIGNFQMRATSMAPTLLESYGFNQFVGYTVPTWYGKGGWGTLGLWQQMPGRYSLAEAFFFNNQMLVRELLVNQPSLARTALPMSETSQMGVEIPVMLNPKSHDVKGMLWDRDVVAFYGDPALHVYLDASRLPADVDVKFTPSTPVPPSAFPGSDGTTWLLTVHVGTNTAGIRRDMPFAIMLPWRLPAIDVVDGERYAPVFADDFVMIMKPDYTTNTTMAIAFHARTSATKRSKPDMSPYECTKEKFASCTGLSILYADACRAAGIPARIVGVPLWRDKSGNHNWVEVFDRTWINSGSLSTDPRNPHWVDDRCRTQCDPTNAVHGVYAAVTRRTATHFPLVWNTQDTSVPALDITRFYTASTNVIFAVPPGTESTTTIRWKGEIVAHDRGSDRISFRLPRGESLDVAIVTPDGKKETHNVAF